MATISNQNTIIIVIVIKIFSGLELHGAGPCPCAPWVALRAMGSVELARRGSAFLFFGFSPAFLRFPFPFFSLDFKAPHELMSR